MKDTPFDYEMYDKFCADKLDKFKAALQETAKEVIQDISNEYLPYLGDDSMSNVEHRAEDIIKKLLSGDYTVKDNYLRVEEPYCFVNIAVSTMMWDNFRKELISLMDECPKDKEIESLKEQLKTAYERRWL